MGRINVEIHNTIAVIAGLPCASTQRTVFGCAESAGIERLSRAHELARVAAGVRGMAQYSAAMAASVGGAVTELGRDLATRPGRRCAGNG